MYVSRRASGIELSGSIGAANITASGRGRTDIAGLMIGAAVRASGTSSTNLQTANGDALPEKAWCPHEPAQLAIY